jgi:hypothetical protein
VLEFLRIQSRFVFTGFSTCRINGEVEEGKRERCGVIGKLKQRKNKEDGQQNDVRIKYR